MQFVLVVFLVNGTGGYMLIAHDGTWRVLNFSFVVVIRHRR